MVWILIQIPKRSLHWGHGDIIDFHSVRKINDRLDIQTVFTFRNIVIYDFRSVRKFNDRLDIDRNIQTVLTFRNIVISYDFRCLEMYGPFGYWYDYPNVPYISAQSDIVRFPPDSNASLSRWKSRMLCVSSRDSQH